MPWRPAAPRRRSRHLCPTPEFPDSARVTSPAMALTGHGTRQPAPCRLTWCALPGFRRVRVPLIVQWPVEFGVGHKRRPEPCWPAPWHGQRSVKRIHRLAPSLVVRPGCLGAAWIATGTTCRQHKLLGTCLTPAAPRPRGTPRPTGEPLFGLANRTHAKQPSTVIPITTAPVPSAGKTGSVFGPDAGVSSQLRRIRQNGAGSPLSAAGWAVSGSGSVSGGGSARYECPLGVVQVVAPSRCWVTDQPGVCLSW